MFIDRTKIFVKSGEGGDGCLSFRREKYVEKGGPDGGNGGRGGDIYLLAKKRYSSLYDFSKKRHFVAEGGANGKSGLKHGKSGKDVIIEVPCGTLIYTYDETSDKKTFKTDLVNENDCIRILSGGRGGRGNAAFKNANRTAPRIVEKGEPSKELTIILELKLIANIGLLGYPNAGKSTFLASITNAKPKIADYPFTTIKPNLGVVQYFDKNFVIADIPGIIEGAHKGIGLGFDFLRHVERTQILMHLIDINENIYEKFINMNKELLLYNKNLAKKEQIILLTKKDTFNPDRKKLLELKKIKSKILKYKKIKVLEIFEISAVSNEGLDDILKFLYNNSHKLEQQDDFSNNLIDLSEEKNLKEFTLNPEFYIEKIDDIFYVKGEKIEKLASMTYFNELDALMRFQMIITKMGVDKALKDKGVLRGDIVKIGDFEFYYE